MAKEWRHYINSLKHSAMLLSEHDDELICWSKNKSTGTFVVKICLVNIS